jgi:4-amino-4-deoxy-L-arabinose transferase-like glycosyltransferase
VAAGVVVLIVPWFVHQTVRAGSDVWDVMFGWHVFVRFTASLPPPHLHPWACYFVEIWTQLSHAVRFWLVAVGGGLVLFDTLRRRWPEGVMAVTWFMLPITLMSLGTSKLGHYAFPFLPPLARAAWLSAASWLPFSCCLSPRFQRTATLSRAAARSTLHRVPRTEDHRSEAASPGATFGPGWGRTGVGGVDGRTGAEGRTWRCGAPAAGTLSARGC